MTALRAGDRVYRVVEDDPPGEGPHTWTVSTVVVKSASAKQIMLRGYFSGVGRRAFAVDALGRVFFQTESSAIQWFLEHQRREIEALDRHRATADRAIAWAYKQMGVTT